MTSTTQTTQTTQTTFAQSMHEATRTRFVLQAGARYGARRLYGVRALSAALLLFGAATLASPAGATSCQPAYLAVDGGTVSNQTVLDLSADGGIAVSNANGGNDNVAVGGNGGFFGDGGNAAAGNGGFANASANGGMIDLDDVNSGNNQGNAIAVSGVGSCGPAGQLAISGGTVRNDTTLALSADGGVAISNANGGNDNVAVAGNGGFFGDGGNALAGNGGLARSSANGGVISVGNVNSGNNRGNTIVVGLGGWFGVQSTARIDGGTVRNRTTLAISADGGTAVSNANGGNDNVAVGGNGGFLGDGGNAAAGNGGIAVAEANGGAVTIGNINSGGNVGNTIAVSGVQGSLAVSGGTVTNETTISVSADGGTAVSNANGGNDNVAVGGQGGAIGDGGNAAAGNGGVADSEANGGSIEIGDINSGENVGNTIIVGN